MRENTFYLAKRLLENPERVTPANVKQMAAWIVRMGEQGCEADSEKLEPPRDRAGSDRGANE